jgi:ribosomal protein S18 acetylase RimI-like enzyme
MQRRASIRIERYGAEALPRHRGGLVAVYGAANANHRDDPFFSVDAFWTRLVDSYAPSPGFGLVAGWLADEMVGFAFGSPRKQSGEIWRMVRHTVPGIPVPDEDEPIYVLREIAVRPPYQRSGYGRALHDALLDGRPERLAQLLVLSDNRPARAAYRAWGWRDAGRRQPFPDGPVGETMVRILR